MMNLHLHVSFCFTKFWKSRRLTALNCFILIKWEEKSAMKIFCLRLSNYSHIYIFILNEVCNNLCFQNRNFKLIKVLSKNLLLLVYENIVHSYISRLKLFIFVYTFFQKRLFDRQIIKFSYITQNQRNFNILTIWMIQVKTNRKYFTYLDLYFNH